MNTETIESARVIDLAPAYQMAREIKAEILTAEAEALAALAEHAATIRRLSADLRVAKAENARLRGILKIRGIRA